MWNEVLVRGDTIRVGDNIKITIVGFIDGEVRIGIEAPKHVRIIRDDARNQTPKHIKR
ncbi:carbon storage regulator [Pseudomonas sp. GV071]|uniref:carbon storage regulator n=1 Tax=Pseudomonas sp. GV071 TaxID=2135754 RepID=UPI000D35699D|nr:carbon storage regulator [Pseudomonas sp. GV071]PTQ70381.1 carbon storage regulator CsrA [Pseudomonas sp. GV071]